MTTDKAMLRILVTGLTFLGSSLVDFLLEKDHTVIGLDNLTTGSPANLRHLKNHPSFTFINQDICSPFDWRQEIDQIYNLACPGSPLLRDGRVISNFIASALSGNALNIYGDGLATRSFQYVTDCLEGLYRLMNSGYSAGPVDIGNDKEFTIQEAADLVIELVSDMTNKPRATVDFLPKPLDDPSVRRPQVSLAKKELSWEAVVPLRDGLQKTIEWHMNQQGPAK
ncbi:hypothetical protein N7451_007185 [Penicillium sp. IBT 35674x]|nr:hypothetical protein N7451_007185 [Penicillium sp. IBT 35674x]